MTAAESIERAVVGLVRRRGPGDAICPFDAARALRGDVGLRALTPAARATTVASVDRGGLEVTRTGRVVDPRAARGAIRLRLAS